MAPLQPHGPPFNRRELLEIIWPELAIPALPPMRSTAAAAAAAAENPQLSSDLASSQNSHPRVATAVGAVGVVTSAVAVNNSGNAAAYNMGGVSSSKVPPGESYQSIKAMRMEEKQKGFRGLFNRTFKSKGATSKGQKMPPPPTPQTAPNAEVLMIAPETEFAFSTESPRKAGSGSGQDNTTTRGNPLAAQLPEASEAPPLSSSSSSPVPVEVRRQSWLSRVLSIKSQPSPVTPTATAAADGVDDGPSVARKGVKQDPTVRSSAARMEWGIQEAPTSHQRGEGGLPVSPLPVVPSSGDCRPASVPSSSSNQVQNIPLASAPPPPPFQPAPYQPSAPIGIVLVGAPSDGSRSRPSIDPDLRASVVGLRSASSSSSFSPLGPVLSSSSIAVPSEQPLPQSPSRGPFRGGRDSAAESNLQRAGGDSSSRYGYASPASLNSVGPALVQGSLVPRRESDASGGDSEGSSPDYAQRPPDRSVRSGSFGSNSGGDGRGGTEVMEFRTGPPPPLTNPAGGSSPFGSQPSDLWPPNPAYRSLDGVAQPITSGMWPASYAEGRPGSIGDSRAAEEDPPEVGPGRHLQSSGPPRDRPQVQRQQREDDVMKPRPLSPVPPPAAALGAGGRRYSLGPPTSPALSAMMQV